MLFTSACPFFFFVLLCIATVSAHPQTNKSTTDNRVLIYTEDPPPHQSRENPDDRLLRPECVISMQEGDNSNSNKHKIVKIHNLIYSSSLSNGKHSICKQRNWHKSSSYGNRYKYINHISRFNYNRRSSHMRWRTKQNKTARTTICFISLPPSLWTRPATTKPTLPPTTTVTTVATGFD